MRHDLVEAFLLLVSNTPGCATTQVGPRKSAHIIGSDRVIRFDEDTSKVYVLRGGADATPQWLDPHDPKTWMRAFLDEPVPPYLQKE